MPTIDLHNHYYPPAYLDALSARPTHVKVGVDGEGNPLLFYPGDYNIVVPGHRDIDYRERVLETHGVDMQVVTLTTPGTHVEEPALAAELARLVNDAFADVIATRRRFSALATLPLNDPAASAKELERAMTRLKLPGAMLFSNVNGTALADQRFWPLYEVANDLEAVLYIHPNHPISVEAMTEYWLMPLVGFLFDSTLAAAGLVFSGVTERFPQIKWVSMHLGGAIPYLAERLDRGFEAFADCRAHIKRHPSEYLKEFYFDSVNFDLKCLRLAIEFAGVDHILSGSDYPHMIGSLAKMKSSIVELGLSKADTLKIQGENAAKLLGNGK
jgi:aminocarboxymuconate-semialdehyde decarboxylase